MVKKHTHVLSTVLMRRWKCGVCKKQFTHKELISEPVFCMNCGKETIVTRNNATNGKVYCFTCMPYTTIKGRAEDKLFFELLESSIGQIKLIEIQKIADKERREREARLRAEMRERNKALRKQKREEEKAIREARKALKESIPEIPKAAILSVVEEIAPKTEEDFDTTEGFFDA